MIDKKLSEITLVDLQELIDDSVYEGKTIDFKQEYSLVSDKEKGEFLADVSSFANSLGGHLIIGIREEAGTAKEIISFCVDNIDKEKQKIENIVRDGISPRIIIDLRFIDIGSQKYILILKIMKSWSLPNRVIFAGYSKTKDQFYARNSVGKYPLDVVELKNSFILSDTLIEKITKFRIRRTSAIIAGDTPVPLNDGGKIILHLIPVESFTPAISFNISEIIKNPSKLTPVYSGGYDRRINLEGLLTFSSGRKEKSYSYTQLYRTGIIEAVDAYIIGDELGRDNENKYIPSVLYESELLKSLKQYLSLLQELGINPPLVIFLTLTGVKNYKMAVNRMIIRSNYDNFKIDRDILNLPEHFIENYDEKAEGILRPIFDLIWNACGYQRSFNFDENGNWVDQ